MGEFLRGWKRKVGVVSLAIAATLAIAWCSSFYSIFWVRVAVSQSSGIQFVTGDGCLTVLVIHNASIFDCFFDRGSSDNPKAIYKYERPDYVWLLRSPHVRYGDDQGTKGRIITVSVSFTLVVIPLTLLSAYLLLSKPRRLTQKKFTEPTANQRT